MPWGTTRENPPLQGSTLAFVATELTRADELPGLSRSTTGPTSPTSCLSRSRMSTASPAVDLYEDRIYRHLGAERPALVNLDPAGNPIVEGQVNLTLRDFVRWGYLLAE